MGEKSIGNVNVEILLVTHGRAGEELIKSAEMILGTMEGVSAISLMPGISPEEFAREIENAIERIPEGSLIIADLFGGTPCNVSMIESEKKNISIVSGLNLAMLVEAVNSRSFACGGELASTVIDAGIENCKDVLREYKAMDI